MKHLYIVFLLLIGFTQGQTKTINILIEKAHLIFEDNFNRNEKDNTIEDVGNHWKANSVKRAECHKQADLRNGVLFVEMYKSAKHGTSILRTAPFDDGIVKFKFKILNKKGVRIKFNDPKAVHVSNSGHVCQIGITPTQIKLIDQLTGVFQLDIYKKRKNKTDKEEVLKLLEGKSSNHQVNLKVGNWYELTMLFDKDVLSVYINDNYVGQLKSDGIDHKVKDNIALVLWSSSAEFDDFKIWSLDEI